MLSPPGGLLSGKFSRDVSLEACCQEGNSSGQRLDLESLCSLWGGVEEPWDGQQKEAIDIRTLLPSLLSLLESKDRFE